MGVGIGCQAAEPIASAHTQRDRTLAGKPRFSKLIPALMTQRETMGGRSRPPLEAALSFPARPPAPPPQHDADRGGEDNRRELLPAVLARQQQRLFSLAQENTSL